MKLYFRKTGKGWCSTSSLSPNIKSIWLDGGYNVEHVELKEGGWRYILTPYEEEELGFMGRLRAAYKVLRHGPAERSGFWIESV
jgi:hypothetical protein